MRVSGAMAAACICSRKGIDRGRRIVLVGDDQVLFHARDVREAKAKAKYRQVADPLQCRRPSRILAKCKNNVKPA
jgi:hypothetical protein